MKYLHNIYLCISIYILKHETNNNKIWSNYEKNNSFYVLNTNYDCSEL